MSIQVQAFDHIVLNVSDVERSLGWYMGTLGLEGVRVAEWQAGEVPFPSVRVSEATLIDLIASERAGENLDHFCLVVAAGDLGSVRTSGEFEVVRDMGETKLYGARGMAEGVYVRDPDGNVIELRSY